MKMLWQKVCKLIDVKSIVTIMVTAIFCYLSAEGRIEKEQFMTVFTVIISFYFGTQYEKYNGTDKKE